MLAQKVDAALLLQPLEGGVEQGDGDLEKALPVVAVAAVDHAQVVLFLPLLAHGHKRGGKQIVHPQFRKQLVQHHAAVFEQLDILYLELALLSHQFGHLAGETHALPVSALFGAQFIAPQGVEPEQVGAGVVLQPQHLAGAVVGRHRRTGDIYGPLAVGAVLQLF